MLLVIISWQSLMDILYPPPPETEGGFPLSETIPQTGFTEQQPERQPWQQTQEQQNIPPTTQQDIPVESSLGSIQKTTLPEQWITIQSGLYRGIITTKGGTIEEWILSDFPDRNDPGGAPVNIIRNNDAGNLSLSFISMETFERVDLAGFDFVPESPVILGETYTFSVRDRPRSLTLAANLGNNRIVRKKFTFYPDSYLFDLDVEFVNGSGQDLVAYQKYTLTWGSGIRTSEENIQEDMQFSKIIALLGSDIEKFDVGGDSEKRLDEKRPVFWSATKSKYFCALVIPKDTPGEHLQVIGQTFPEDAETIGEKNYVSSITMLSQELRNSFSVYLGPINNVNFEEIQAQFPTDDLQLKGLLDINSYIRPLSMLIYSIFNFLHGFIPNYGAVIIIFSFLINLVMFPLTAKSYKSMKKMSEMQPLMSELKEKYKKEPQKLQQAQIKLYKEKKVNPIGGCLPMLLQMPVFFAIYPIFKSIDLRGEPFIWWITDLSQPDTVAILPFSIPMFGDHLNILTIIYAISLFIQQKIMMKDPKQKMLVYIMPVMLLLFLNRLSSGFILYFIIFNLLSISQRYLVSGKDKPGTSPAPVPALANPKKSAPKKRAKKSKKK